MYKLLIWGTGKIAREILNNEISGSVVGYIETKKGRDSFERRKVYSPEGVLPEFDYIIVANSYVEEIYQLCEKCGIDLNKVIFLKEIHKKVGCQDLEVIKSILGEKNYNSYCISMNIHSGSFFYDDMKKYISLNERKEFDIQEKYIWPIISDKYAKAGLVDNYFMQDLWAAKLIYKSGVKKHFDIGSRIDGFIAHLLAMDIEVSIIDIREFPIKVEGLYTIVDDATTLSQIEDNSIRSMSALCSLEHFGLGRYGDSINPEACFECFNNIQKKLAKGGHLYISVPIGMERVEFNAGRMFYASTIIESFSDLRLCEYACTAEGEIEYNGDIHKYDNCDYNSNHRYGLFHFIK